MHTTFILSFTPSLHCYMNESILIFWNYVFIYTLTSDILIITRQEWLLI